jgi:hypothetical protein
VIRSFDMRPARWQKYVNLGMASIPSLVLIEIATEERKSKEKKTNKM